MDPRPRTDRTSPLVTRDRWLVSYADFTTLLFAFFTMMYALSTVDVQKRQAAAESVERAFESGRPQSAARADAPWVASLPGGAALMGDHLDTVRLRLATAFEREMAAGQIALAIDRRGLVISIREAGSFAPGGADLSPATRAMLGTIAAPLRAIGNELRIEGHTDDAPLRTPRFGSNWDLSTARATAVVAYLTSAPVGLSPRRLSAAGYGEFRPVAPNDTEPHRARNRRVDLVVLNASTRAAEEPAR